MSAWAVVVAAGRGTRAGQGVNKVFRLLAGSAVLARTLRALEDSDVFDGIVLVLAPDDIPLYEEMQRREGPFPLVSSVVYGGATRTESVYNGLLSVPGDTQIIAIHDGARPFVSTGLVKASVDSARQKGSGVVAAHVVDTIKCIDAQGYVCDTPDRSSLRAAQTPQSFRFAQILQAYQEALARKEEATDDASLYERHIGPVCLVVDDTAGQNRKLTTPQDFLEAERMLSTPRIGTGYDVHRLVPDRRLVLCGVEIPYEKGLLGHSDADVATHALMDALLGAAALPDIGQLFPDTDPAYAGADSLVLLARVRDLLAQKGMHIHNVDLTIVAQRPKLAPYNEQMRKRLAAVLGLPISSVGVKATTTERLGFEGEGLGISAQAVALVQQCL